MVALATWPTSGFPETITNSVPCALPAFPKSWSQERTASPKSASSHDLFPTLCELTGLNQPSLVGRSSLLLQINDPSIPGHSAIAYNNKGKTIRTENYRLILHNDGYAELYDHRTSDAETNNLATIYPEIVSQLREQLKIELK